MSYLIFKAIHLIGVICWFVTLFYLPRLFVYHVYAQQENDIAGQKRFSIMERRLAIMGKISFVIALIGGSALIIINSQLMKQGWLHLKLFLVFLLFAYSHYCLLIIKRFKNGQNKKSAKFYRIFNEIPSLILLAVVFLAVLKPF